MITGSEQFIVLPVLNTGTSQYAAPGIRLVLELLVLDASLTSAALLSRMCTHWQMHNSVLFFSQCALGASKISRGLRPRTPAPKALGAHAGEAGRAPSAARFARTLEAIGFQNPAGYAASWLEILEYTLGS